MVDGSLHISTLTPGDSGKYTCMPTNGLLAPPTASADLTVMRESLYANVVLCCCVQKVVFLEFCFFVSWLLCMFCCIFTGTLAIDN